MCTSHDQLGAAELVRLARDSDQVAWSELVRRFAPMLWRVAAAYRLDAADAKDVCQSTWCALAAHLPRLRHPDRLAGWLVTTARREAVRLHRREPWPGPAPETADPRPEHRPESRALRSARDRLLWRAFAGLPDRCQRLLGLLAHAPELSYAQLAGAVGLKAGSVGPARGRCLHELRRHLAGLGLELP